MYIRTKGAIIRKCLKIKLDPEPESLSTCLSMGGNGESRTISKSPNIITNVESKLWTARTRTCKKIVPAKHKIP